MLVELLTSIAPLRTWALIAAVTAALAAVGAGLWLMRHDAYEAGKSEATQEISDANRKADDAADAASSRVTRCYGTGGTWDRARGVCAYPAGR
jgi:hypothetical protein